MNLFKQSLLFLNFGRAREVGEARIAANCGGWCDEEHDGCNHGEVYGMFVIRPVRIFP